MLECSKSRVYREQSLNLFPFPKKSKLKDQRGIRQEQIRRTHRRKTPIKITVKCYPKICSIDFMNLVVCSRFCGNSGFGMPFGKVGSGE